MSVDKDPKQAVKRLQSEEKIIGISDSMNHKRAVDFVSLLGHIPANEAEKKLEFLYNSVHASLREAAVRRLRNRGPALVFKMLTTGLSAVVTVLLGIKVYEGHAIIINNTALIISAFMTLISGLSSFMDNQALWVEFTVMGERLKVLLKEIEYFTMGNENVDIDAVAMLRNKYSEIIEAASKKITELRSEDSKNG